MIQVNDYISCPISNIRFEKLNQFDTLMIKTIHFQNENFTFSEFFAVIRGKRYKKQGPSINNHEVLNQ